MEYLEGEALQELIMREGQLDAANALQISIQIAEALNYAHQLGIIHRDIKPANIMLLQGNHVKVMDFGIARLVDAVPQTHPGTSLGTPEFMSPEQVGGKEVDPRSDIYSLGCVLFYAVTGSYPFQGETPVATALMHERQPMPRPSRVNADLPSALDDLVVRSTAKKTEERFATAQEFADAMRNVLEELGSKVTIESAAESSNLQVPQGDTAIMHPRPLETRAPDGEQLRIGKRKTRKPFRTAILIALLVAIVGVLALAKYLPPILAEKSYQKAMQMAREGIATESAIFEEFEKSIRYNPQYYEARRDYGEVLFWYGHFAEAAEKLQKALSLGEPDEFRAETEKILEDAKRFASQTNPEASPTPPEATPITENATE